MAEGPINTGRSPTSRRAGREPECRASAGVTSREGAVHTRPGFRGRRWASALSHRLSSFAYLGTPRSLAWP